MRHRPPRHSFLLTLDRTLTDTEISTMLRELTPKNTIIHDHAGGRYVEAVRTGSSYADTVEQTTREIEALGGIGETL